jgi:hypothetical protein
MLGQQAAGARIGRKATHTGRLVQQLRLSRAVVAPCRSRTPSVRTQAFFGGLFGGGAPAGGNAKAAQLAEDLVELVSSPRPDAAEVDGLVRLGRMHAWATQQKPLWLVKCHLARHGFDN